MSAEQTTATEPGFVIDGETYPFPDMSGLDMDEREILFELAGVVEEDFVRDEDEDEEEYDERVRQALRHPGFFRAFMTIAYLRAHPGAKRKTVDAVIGKTRYTDAMREFADRELEETGDGGADPTPTSTNELERSSPRSSDDFNANGGADSSGGSGEPGELPAPIGTSRSDISSGSDRESSET